METNDIRACMEAGLSDPQIRGLYRAPDGSWRFDFRYTDDAVAQSPLLTPRTADLNMATPETVAIPDDMAVRLGLDN